MSKQYEIEENEENYHNNIEDILDTVDNEIQEDSKDYNENDKNLVEFYEWLEFENKILNSYSSFCEEVNDYNHFHCLDNKIINLKNINIMDFLTYMNKDE